MMYEYRKTMPWQKVVRHISDSRIVVESKLGNQYPVTPEYESDGRALYEQLLNSANDARTYWAFIQFQDGHGPVLIDWTVLKDKEPPEKAPWGH